jgi:hypothetical protein
METRCGEGRERGEEEVEVEEEEEEEEERSGMTGRREDGRAGSIL